MDMLSSRSCKGQCEYMNNIIRIYIHMCKLVKSPFVSLRPTDHGQYTGLLRNNFASAEQRAVSVNTASIYDEIQDYDHIVNEEN